MYICIEWDIQNGNPDELIGNSDGVTYIGISDIFSKNFEIINASINNLESSVGDISTKFRLADASIYSGLKSYIDTDVSSLKEADASIYSGLKSYIDTDVSSLKEADARMDTSINLINRKISVLDASLAWIITHWQEVEQVWAAAYIDLSTYVHNH